MRTLDEWVGKTDDSPAPKAVRLRVFARYEGKCYLSGQVIRAGDAWELEHVKPLWGGGENRENNLAPALKAAHRVKTTSEAKARSKADRVRLKHLGQWPQPVRKIPSKPFARRGQP